MNLSGTVSVCLVLKGSLVSVSVLVTGLFRMLISFGLTSGVGMLLEPSISFRFSNWMEYRFLKYSFILLRISLISVVVFHLWFLIQLIWVLSIS